MGAIDDLIKSLIKDAKSNKTGTWSMDALDRGLAEADKKKNKGKGKGKGKGD